MVNIVRNDPLLDFFSAPVISELVLEQMSIEELTSHYLNKPLDVRIFLSEHLRDDIFLSLPQILHEEIIQQLKPTLEDYQDVWKAKNLDPFKPTCSFEELKRLKPYLSDYFSKIDPDQLQEKILTLQHESSTLPLVLKDDENSILCLKLIFETIFQNKTEIVLKPKCIGFTPASTPRFFPLSEKVTKALSEAAKNVNKITLDGFQFDLKIFEMLKKTGREIDARKSNLNFSKNAERIQLACIVLFSLAGAVAAAVGCYFLILSLGINMAGGFLFGGWILTAMGGWTPGACLLLLFWQMQKNRNRTLYYKPIE